MERFEMTDTRNDSPELARMVEEIGLGKLNGLSPHALGKALAAARRLKSEIPGEFALSDEPAHVYRAGPEA